MKKSLLIIASVCLVVVITIASTGNKPTATIAKDSKPVVHNNGHMLEDQHQFN